MKSIHELVKEYKEDHNLSYREFGNLIGVSGTTIENIAKKKFSPSLDLIRKFSTLFKKTFIIAPDDEPLKYFDAYTDLNDILQPSLDKDLIDFINNPDNEKYIRLAMIIKEHGFNSNESKAVGLALDDLRKVIKFPTNK